MTQTAQANRFYDALIGFQGSELSRIHAKQAAEAAQKGDLIGNVLGAVGTIGGAVIGGPPGAAIGGSIGRGVGGGGGVYTPMPVMTPDNDWGWRYGA